MAFKVSRFIYKIGTFDAERSAYAWPIRHRQNIAAKAVATESEALH